MQRTRTYRRHQHHRARQRAHRQLTLFWGPPRNTDDPSGIEFARRARHFLKQRTPCSCPKCGNPRKWLGEMTREERLADHDQIVEMAEFFGRDR